MSDSMSKPALSQPLVMLAAGGTGGHLFPAEALARELLARRIPAVLVTDRRGKAFGEALGEIPIHRIRAATLGPGLIGKLRTMIELGAGTIQARALLGRLRPAVVVGFGGYPSLPAALAARLTGTPLVIHEQNAVLGRANRLVVAGASRIAVSFPEVAGVPAACAGRVVVTGNPVRPGMAAARAAPYRLPAGDEPFRILVIGGSQGARVFSEVLPAALANLPAEVRGRLRLVQQARVEDLELARRAYAHAGMAEAVELSPFFNDIPERMAAAHLVICRAGASTLAELTAAGRPAILVPYPHAMDDHQTANARALAAVGGAWLMPQPVHSAAGLTAELTAELTALLQTPADLERAAAAARDWGAPDAAARLADAVLEAMASRPVTAQHSSALETAK
jgi:UDP-N-acetylglucosamine--N-acetylmuramyl-(pentapeptide) pyrophosphoryl-undecaprenol N-acetylglucosamine transferase